MCNLKLILEIFSKLILNGFYKSSEIVAIFVEKDFKFFLGHNNIWLFFLSLPIFVFYPASANTIVKKKCHKWYIIVSINSSCIKIIIAFLTELIAIHMRFSKLQVRKISLECLFFKFYWC